jgi:hypothetical protein
LNPLAPEAPGEETPAQRSERELRERRTLEIEVEDPGHPDPDAH